MAYPLGTITFVLSENHREDPPFLPDEVPAITQPFVNYFKAALAEYGIANEVEVTKVESSIGCVTIIISIGAAVAGGYALVEFLKKYKEISESIHQMIEDFKNIKGWIKRKFSGKHATSISPSTDPAVLDQSPEVLDAVFEQLSKNYQATAPEHRKYWAAGQEIVVLNERGELTRITVSVKRVDLVPSGQLELAAEPVAPEEKKKKRNQ
jgi:hypothetical protein